MKRRSSFYSVKSATLLAGFVGACSPTGASNLPPAAQPDDGSGQKMPPQVIEQSYDGHGFIVHEWGTNTLVVGSDGSLQRGLHHEEEDLPAFVYDRVKAGAVPSNPSVELKMETPVAYFYSDKALTATVSVGFPQGVLTQWYPSVQSFRPSVGMVYWEAQQRVADPVLDLRFPFMSQHCRDQYSKLEGGLLDWGKVEVLAQNTDVTAALPPAPLEKYSWSHARNVESNPLRAAPLPGTTDAPQYEKFLFYRGLGNTPIPVRVSAGSDGKLTLNNHDSQNAVGAVFVLNVTASTASFALHAEGVAATGTLSFSIPQAMDALDTYKSNLKTAMTAELVKTGLFTDEAQAMVETWSRQWFGTPGVRLLYLSPRAWTDAQIPLSVSPAADSMVRVMVIRTEVLLPELEAEDTRQAAALDDSDPQKQSLAAAYFKNLGRFAEPRLRRALSLLGSTPPLASAYLDSIATASTVLSSGE